MQNYKKNINNTYYHNTSMQSVTTDIGGVQPLPEVVPNDMLHGMFAQYLETLLCKQTNTHFKVYNVGEGLNPHFYGFEDTSCNRNNSQRAVSEQNNSFYRFIFCLSTQRWSLLYISPGSSVQSLIEETSLNRAAFSYLVHKDEIYR